MKAFLDTHAAVFMAAGDRAVFGAAALDLIDRSAVFCSPFVELELVFLHEIGRLKMDACALIGALATNYGVSLSEESTPEVVAEARQLSWTRDPFDRLIVATAALHRSPLITKDERILERYPRAVW